MDDKRRRKLNRNANCNLNCNAVNFNNAIAAMNDDAQINRLRWQSRRGTLELDLILDKFWRRKDLHSAENLSALSELLSLDDEELRGIFAINGGGEAGRGDDESFTTPPSAAKKIAGVLRDL